MASVADYNVANASGASVRSDINNILQAVVTLNSGTSEPSTMYPFMLWIDTTNNLVKMRNGANDAWLTMPLSMSASNQTSGDLTVNGDLEVSSALPRITLTDTDGGYHRINGVGTNLIIQADEGNTEANSTIQLHLDGDEKLRLTTTGLGINNTSPSQLLDVTGRVAITGDNSVSGSGLTMADYASGGYAWIQSFNSRPLYINPLGNNVILNRDGSNVGINTTSPSAPLEIKASTTAIRLTDADNTSVYHELMCSGNNGLTIRVDENNANSASALIIDIDGDEQARFISSGGLTFNGDTATANALNDYERGTWTPVYRGSTTEGTYTYAVQQGSYVKVGELVTVWCNLNAITDTTEGTGSVRIAGLPYNAVSSDGVSWYPGACILEHFNVDAACVNLAAAADDATDRVAFWETKDNLANDTVSIADRSSDAADIWFTCTYRTAP